MLIVSCQTEIYNMQARLTVFFQFYTFWTSWYNRTLYGSTTAIVHISATFETLKYRRWRVKSEMRRFTVRLWCVILTSVIGSNREYRKYRTNRRHLVTSYVFYRVSCMISDADDISKTVVSSLIKIVGENETMLIRSHYPVEVVKMEFKIVSCLTLLD